MPDSRTTRNLQKFIRISATTARARLQSSIEPTSTRARSFSISIVWALRIDRWSRIINLMPSVSSWTNFCNRIISPFPYHHRRQVHSRIITSGRQKQILTYREWKSMGSKIQNKNAFSIQLFNQEMWEHILSLRLRSSNPTWTLKCITQIGNDNIGKVCFPDGIANCQCPKPSKETGHTQNWQTTTWTRSTDNSANRNSGMSCPLWVGGPTTSTILETN